MQSQVMSIITSNLISYLWTSKNKNLGTLLDPINTAVCISLLNFYPDGTKISIQNNEITFQEPGTTQSISRWGKGDKFEDLHNLINPIKKLLEKKKMNIWGKENVNFKYLCNSMLLGLTKLSETYKNNQIAHHTLEFYKSLITENLENKSHFLEKIKTDEDKNFDIYQQFFEQWNADQINVMVVLLENISSEKKIDIKASYKSALMIIINGHNEIIKNIINKIQSGIVD